MAACFACRNFLTRLEEQSAPTAGAICWVFNAPHADSAVTCLQHQEIAQLYTNFNVEFSTKPCVPSPQGIPVNTRHILFKALAAGLPDDMSLVCPSAISEVKTFLNFNRLDPSTGCYDHERAMDSAHRLAEITNGHRRDLLIRTL